MIVTAAMEILADEFGQPYLACDVAPDHVSGDLERLAALIGAPAAAAYNAKLLARNAGAYHITIVSPPEWSRLGLQREAFEPRQFSFRLFGLGRAELGEDAAYYTVCEAGTVQDFRLSLGLPPRDLHITLAFRNADIHTVPKDRGTLVPGDPGTL